MGLGASRIGPGTWGDASGDHRFLRCLRGRNPCLHQHVRDLLVLVLVVSLVWRFVLW